MYLDRDATVAELIRSVRAAGAAGAHFVVFPEAIVPGYPDWVWRLPAWSDAGWYRRLHDRAVVVPGSATDRLGAPAAAIGAWVVVGVTERVPSGTL